MHTLTTLVACTFTLLLALRVHAWPFGLYYDDECHIRARAVWRTPVINSCLIFTNTNGPAFIAVEGNVGDGLDWDKDWELCLYDKNHDCLNDQPVRCFPAGNTTCTRLPRTHVIKFQEIPKNHTNALYIQGQDGVL